MKTRIDKIYQIGDKAIVTIESRSFLVNLDEFLTKKNKIVSTEYGEVIPYGSIMCINNYEVKDDIIYFTRNVVIDDELKFELRGTINKDGKIQNWFDVSGYEMYLSDFWRRWHISLSTFFRDYVYIPLGGNRCKGARHIFNLFVVWALTGLWHGASWNFVFWGLFYFVLLVLEK